MQVKLFLNTGSGRKADYDWSIIWPPPTLCKCAQSVAWELKYRKHVELTTRISPKFGLKNRQNWPQNPGLLSYPLGELYVHDCSRKKYYTIVPYPVSSWHGRLSFRREDVGFFASLFIDPFDDPDWASNPPLLIDDLFFGLDMGLSRRSSNTIYWHTTTILPYKYLPLVRD